MQEVDNIRRLASSHAAEEESRFRMVASQRQA
jgi:hypothetical protein